MKKTIAITMIALGCCLIVFLLFKNEKTSEVSLNEPFKLSLHESVSIPDAKLNLTLESVSDSTCKGDVVCVWEGEYSYHILVNDESIVLGTVRKREESYNDYLIKIADNDYTLEYVTLEVSKK